MQYNLRVSGNCWFPEKFPSGRDDEDLGMRRIAFEVAETQKVRHRAFQQSVPILAYSSTKPRGDGGTLYAIQT